MVIILAVVILIPNLSFHSYSAAPPIADANYAGTSSTCGFAHVNAVAGDTIVVIIYATAFTYNPKITDQAGNTYTKTTLIQEGSHGLNIGLFYSHVTNTLTTAQTVSTNATGNAGGFFISCMLFGDTYTPTGGLTNTTIGTITGPFNVSIGNAPTAGDFGTVYGFIGSCSPTWQTSPSASGGLLSDACQGAAQNEVRLDENVQSNSKGQYWQLANFAGSDMNSAVALVFSLSILTITSTVTGWQIPNFVNGVNSYSWFYLMIIVFIPMGMMDFVLFEGLNQGKVSTDVLAFFNLASLLLGAIAGAMLGLVFPTLIFILGAIFVIYLWRFV